MSQPSVVWFEAETITLDQVKSMAQENKDAGHRFLTMTVVNLNNDFLDILYHFDNNLAMHHYRLTVAVGVPVPTISDIYFCSLLIENESRDHYGIIFEGLVLDFKGSLYLEPDIIAPLMRGPSCTISTGIK